MPIVLFIWFWCLLHRTNYRNWRVLPAAAVALLLICILLGFDPVVFWVGERTIPRPCTARSTELSSVSISLTGEDFAPASSCLFSFFGFSEGLCNDCINSLRDDWQDHVFIAMHLLQSVKLPNPYDRHELETPQHPMHTTILDRIGCGV